MEIFKTNIEGVLIIEPKVFVDKRDDSLGIDWRIGDKAILSEKDTKHVLLKDFVTPFNIKIALYE